MTGYQETLTDPSYHRQVVVMTAPHVGNTGVNDEDPESARIWVAGLRRARPGAACRATGGRTGSLDDELAAQGVVGISGIDTRALTRHLRERGAMRVGISSDGADPDAAARARAGRRRRWPVPRWPPRSVHRPSRTSCPAVGEQRFTVAALDLGIKAMTPRRMAERGIEVHRAARRRPRSTTCSRSSPTGCSSPTAPATRRRPTPRSPCSAACSSAASRTSASASATSCSAARSASAPTSSSTATAASTSRSWTARPARSRSRRTTTASRSRRRCDADHRRRRTAAPRSATSASTTTWSRGSAGRHRRAAARRSACSTTPRRRPARTTPATCSTGSST